MAAEAEDHKRTKYQELDSMYLSVCVSGDRDIRSFRPSGHSLFFFTDPGKRVTDQLDEPRAYSSLLQCVAVKVQRSNAAAISGTLS